MGSFVQGDEPSYPTVLLYSFLSELRSLSYESEVVLTVMRFCSEFVSRGILFSLCGDVFKGVGKFGIDEVGNGRSVEEAIRSLRIRVSESSVFKDIIQHDRAIVNCPENDIGLIQVRAVLGGKLSGLQSFVIPIAVRGKGVYAVYGDNYPGETSLDSLDTVITFINQASLTLEKIILERALATRESNS